ncbi:hypothetical protein SBA2_220009 [Acidobacteriia bacterium SbA2]|nr:hypothetical protein SBA2_220009 [Acidobacteriia bacterium SbA2]
MTDQPPHLELRATLSPKGTRGRCHLFLRPSLKGGNLSNESDQASHFQFSHCSPCTPRRPQGLR